MPVNDGLSSSEAEKLLSQYGPNKLPEKPPPSSFTIFVRQIKSPLVYVLLGAGLITVLLRHFSDAGMILMAVIINTLLGFIQEKRANDSLHALKQMLNPKAEVLRDGERKMINVEEVVPGDIAILNQGYKVPADGQLVHANRLFLQESMLTGESASIPKKHSDDVYMGTIVTGGRGYMKVTKIGNETEMGKIASSIQTVEEETPIKTQLTRFSKQLSILVLVLTVFVFVIGLVSGREVSEVFTTSVALAVSAIPEGLLVGLTVVLAIGMQRILKQQGLVRSLVSAETLGGVTTICVDKTGTLTQGKMEVVQYFGDKENLSIQSIVANDKDDPVVLASYDWGSKNIKKEIHKLIEDAERLDSIPFSSSERFFASLNKWKSNRNMLFVNGAPEYLLEWSTISEKEKKEISEQINKLTSKGMRLIGMARKEVHVEKKRIKKNDVKGKLEWIGFLALSDPVRSGVSDALKKTNKAGIKVLVITGDYAQTAQAVMKEIGISLTASEIVLGTDLDKMSESQLSAQLRQQKIKLFARTTPSQKLKIVDALKQNGEVVAMMGDGVNDAPALSKADIGIVVGNATDVAKESADLVLLDSSFSTIVLSVEEGRGIFDNIRKIILYLMSDAFGAIVVVISSIIFGLPIAITAGQILWVNLIADGFPNLALTVDPKAKGIMDASPRNPKEPLVNNPMKFMIGIISLFGGAIVFLLFVYTNNLYGLETARSIAFASLGINTLFYVYSIRALHQPVWKNNPLSNKWLNVAVVAGLSLQILPFIYEPLGDFLQVIPIPNQAWIYVFTLSLVMFVFIELSKKFTKSRL